jgi:outer membrane protein assembly factor BamE (lipoprotein component of BamABCDE complex)
MIQKQIAAIIMSSVLLLLSGCIALNIPQETLAEMKMHDGPAGHNKKEIIKGMSNSEVTAVLGSPNTTSTDDQGHEVWEYKTIYVDRVVSDISDQALVLISFGRSHLMPPKGQHPLTVVIKFDESKKVRDFAYHSSGFTGMKCT